MMMMFIVDQLSKYIKGYYKGIRFTVAENIWPPEQPKDYIPLVFLHHKHEHTIKNYTTVIEICLDGSIAFDTINRSITMLPMLHNHENFKEIRKSSEISDNILEVLPVPEASNNAQIILIEGAPGMGKTMLLTQIAYKWAEQRALKTMNWSC